MHATQSLLFLLIAVIAVLFAASVREAPVSCTAEQEREQPCQCCKINCWYTIAAAATHKLGHVPGQAGEEEALATLRLIRACMMSSCSEICPIRVRPPFLPQQ